MKNFTSAIPDILSRMKVAPFENPGELSIETLAMLGIIAVREGQLSDAFSLLQNAEEEVDVLKNVSKGFSRENDLLRQNEQIFRRSTARAWEEVRALRSELSEAATRELNAEHRAATAENALGEANAKLAKFEALVLTPTTR